MKELRNIAYIILILAAVYIGHYTTIKGGADNVQCFAPVGLD
jgi:hypothetical protein